MEPIYRALNPQEIMQLTGQACTCADWSLVQVAPDFSPEYIRGVHFVGQVRIGTQQLMAEPEGIPIHSGVYRTTLCECTIGDNVYIADVPGGINRYTIGDNAIIENVAQLSTRGLSRFGNGIRVPVLNEAGGREVPLSDRLTAQIAYLLAMYRHRPGTLTALSDIIEQHARSVASATGTVGEGARLLHCGRLMNLRIGAHATLQGVIRATEGTILSSAEVPTMVGDGTILDEFILCSGATVTDGAILKRCFVGQGCQIGAQFSATNSLFFANCEAFHGEACSVFAGPYTVTHHKSTLLIAGYYSFFNAGSGTNQSNHMYRLEPVHQGILGRVSKTGSDTYLMWPCRTAPFTLVKGHHHGHFDTRDFPFSVIAEKDGISFLSPGANLMNTGTLRDLYKWATRDRRSGTDLRDIVHNDLFSPYLAGSVAHGLEVLNAFCKDCQGKEYIDFQGVRMKKTSLERGIKVYSTYMDRLTGMEISLWLNRSTSTRDTTSGAPPVTPEGLWDHIPTDSAPEPWIDVAGMFAPRQTMEHLCKELEERRINSLPALEEALREAGSIFNTRGRAALAPLIRNHCEAMPGGLSDLKAILKRWEEAEKLWEQMVRADAVREFAGTASIGYGIDGSENIRKEDFEQVRGDAGGNPFFCQLCQEFSERLEQARMLLHPSASEPVPAPEPVPEPAQPIHEVPQSHQPPVHEPASVTKACVNDLLAEHHSGVDMAQALQQAPLRDLAAGIGLNDKFLFTRELFKSNPSLYQQTVARINQSRNLEEALEWLHSRFQWDESLPAVQKFLDLVKRRHS